MFVKVYRRDLTIARLDVYLNIVNFPPDTFLYVPQTIECKAQTQ